MPCCKWWDNIVSKSSEGERAQRKPIAYSTLGVDTSVSIIWSKIWSRILCLLVVCPQNAYILFVFNLYSGQRRGENVCGRGEGEEGGGMERERDAQIECGDQYMKEFFWKIILYLSKVWL